MRLTRLVGGGAALAGLAVAVEPSLARGVSATETMVAFVAAFALLAGATLVRRRLATERDRADLPERETTPDQPVPGDEFDAALRELSPRRDRANDASRSQLRERLEAAALAVLSREGYSRDRAFDALDAGEWTDDPVAAAFFSAEGTAATADDRSLAERLRESVRGPTTFDERARRAALAIAKRAEETDE